MHPIIASFSQYVYDVGYSEGTRRTLVACVRDFWEQQQVTDLPAVGQEQIRLFYEWLQVRPLKKGAGGLSENMIYHHVYALRTFFTWAEVTGQLDYNPVSGLWFKRPEQQGRQALSIAEVKRLFSVVETPKERAVLHLFYSCGLRRSEAEALDSRDINFREQLLYVREGKGARRRVIPLTAQVTKELEQYYLQDRCSSVHRRVRDEGAFMLNRIGDRLRGDGYLKVFRRLTGRAGIGDEYTLHHLRHSIATHLLQSGMSMEYVRDFLGHRYLESTQVYAKPSSEQIQMLCV